MAREAVITGREPAAASRHSLDRPIGSTVATGNDAGMTTSHHDAGTTSSHSGPVDLTGAPFRTATAVACGLTPRMLANERFVRLFRDVYVVAELADDPAVRASGALLLAPHAVIGHGTAARLWDLPLPAASAEDAGTDAEEPVHLLVPPGTAAPRRAGLVVHEVPVPPEDVAVRDGLPLAVPARVLVDVATCWCLADLVALGDAALARGLLDEVDLARRVHEQRGRRGIAAARRVMTRLDGASPSAADSRLRVLLQSADLPRPRHEGEGVLGWPAYGLRFRRRHRPGVAHRRGAARLGPAARPRVDAVPATTAAA